MKTGKRVFTPEFKRDTLDLIERQWKTTGEGWHEIWGSRTLVVYRRAAEKKAALKPTRTKSQRDYQIDLVSPTRKNYLGKLCSRFAGIPVADYAVALSRYIEPVSVHPLSSNHVPVLV